MSRDDIVSAWLGDRGSIPGSAGSCLCYNIHRVLAPTLPIVQYVPGSFPRENRPGREADRSPPVTEVNTAGGMLLPPP
jgi:hypothetical protein